MTLAHIGQKQQIGLGKETTPGTGVAASIWIPKISGSFLPKTQYAYDEGAYGSVDEYRNGQNVKNWTEISFSANAQDINFGHPLLALFGTEYPCVRIPIPGSITGTFVEGEVVTETTSLATATLRRADVGGSTKVLYLQPLTGTLAGVKLLTGGTSGATATGGTIESPSAVNYHLFRKLQTNQPITYSIHGSDPVESDKSLGAALDTLSFEVASGGFAKYDTKWMGKKLASESAPTPSYTANNFLMAKYASLKVASAFSGLDAAAAISVQRVKLDFSNNLMDFQAFGSTDVTEFHNQTFKVTGDITLLYDAVTYRDYAIASTKQAMRLTIANTDVTIGSATNPTLQFDLPSLAFTEFSRDSNNKNIVKQTLKLAGELDLTTALTIQCLLANTQTTSY
jgi:hypothetical protein